MTSPAPPSRDQLLVLDVVRFACALLVVLHHYSTSLAIEPVPWIADRARAVGVDRGWSTWSWSGWVGVEVFFVVSGFVIAKSAEGGGGVAFLKRRALRLAPAAWICASVTALFLLATGLLPAATLAERWLATVTFAPMLVQIDASYWTLPIECVFYLLVAARLGDGKPGAESLERLGLALAAVGAVYWSVGGLVFDRSDNPPLNLLLLTHGCFFATGMALWAIRTRGWSSRRAAMLALGLAAGALQTAERAHFMASGLGLPYGPALPLGILAVAVAAIAWADRLQPWLARTLGARLLGFVGLTTYPLYLIHQFIGVVVIVWLREHGMPTGPAILLTTALAIAAAAAIVRWPEPALRRWLAGVLRRDRPSVGERIHA